MEKDKDFGIHYYALDAYTRYEILCSLKARLKFAGLEEEFGYISGLSSKANIGEGGPVTLTLFHLCNKNEPDFFGFIEVFIDRKMEGWTNQVYDGTPATFGTLQFPEVIINLIVPAEDKKWVQKVDAMPETDIRIRKWYDYGQTWARYHTTLPYDPIGVILKVATVLNKANQLKNEGGEKTWGTEII